MRHSIDEEPSFDQPFQQQQPPVPFYSVNSWDDPRQQQTNLETSGMMQGSMQGQIGPPQQADGSFIPRNISATLLGEGDANEPPILEGGK